MYRPEGWPLKQPVALALEDIAKDDVGAVRVLMPFEKQLFEDGADAMLEGLKDSRDAYSPYSEGLKQRIQNHGFGKGWLVFIPEGE